MSLLALQPPLDKVEHLLLFALIAALLWFSSRNGLPYPVFALVTAVAAADELHVICRAELPAWQILPRT